MPASHSQSRSIRSQMLVTVNLVLMTAMLVFLAIDYREDWHKRLADKRGAMVEEARLLAPAVLRLARLAEGPIPAGIKARLLPGARAPEPVAATEPEDAAATQPSDANLSPAERRRMSLVGRAVVAALPPPPRKPGLDVVENFLQSICERKQVSHDANYQLAVRLGDRWYQARKSNTRPLIETSQLAAAARSKQGFETAEGDTVLVVSDALDDGAVYVTESLDSMIRQAHAMLFWNVLAVLFIGLGVTAIVDLVLLRLVSRPLGALVATVRRMKTGEFGAKAPPGSCREVESLVAEVNQLSQSLKNAETHRARQMDKARRVQERLFPADAQVGPIRVRSVHTAASIVGGDYFDHKVMPDGSVVVILVDVSGHGVPAAMGAAMLKALFDANARITADLLSLIRAINHGFCEVSLEEDFATILLVRVDAAGRRLEYVNAGHETAYVLPAPAAVEGPASPVAAATAAEPAPMLRELHSTGPLVGVIRDAEWRVESVPFCPGDRAVLLTDGVVECRSLAGQMLGRRRTTEVLCRARDLPLDEFNARVIHDIEAFRAGLPPSDDLTLLTLEL